MAPTEADGTDRGGGPPRPHRRRATRPPDLPRPLSELRVADSIFVGYVLSSPSPDSVRDVRRRLIDASTPLDPCLDGAAEGSREEGGAPLEVDGAAEGREKGGASPAHVPYAYASPCVGDDVGGTVVEVYEDDGEPEAAQAGEALLAELRRHRRGLRRQSTVRIRGGSGRSGGDGTGSGGRNAFDLDEESEEEEDNGVEGGIEAGVATAVIVVRYVEKRLLGVTCGRLTALFERTARLALHRHAQGSEKPFVERHSFDLDSFSIRGQRRNLYGLGAGDCELILDAVPEADDMVPKLLSELTWEGMVGSKNEPLPRLQNLQADLPAIDGGTIVPIYRYPGNYSGTEWPTRPWSPATKYVKHLVEEALKPLHEQRMNHCVANLYRTGSDKIDRHSDKDLDLNREGVIVSVSLGSTRIAEVRDRKAPHDCARVELPPGSAFVLGPYTNSRFTHAILPAEDAEGGMRARGSWDPCGHGVKADARAGAGRAAKGMAEGAAEGKGGPRCIVEDGGRISLTFREVRTYLDVRSGRLFGQGVDAEGGGKGRGDGGAGVEAKTEEETPAAAARRIRDEDRRERRTAASVAMVAAFAAGRVASRDEASAEGRSALRGVLTASATGAASYAYLRFLRARARRRREEREARAFFSRKSASGNRY